MADASAYVSHAYPDGSEKPIAFASRILTPSERNYAQVEREGPALIFGTRCYSFSSDSTCIGPIWTTFQTHH